MRPLKPTIGHCYRDWDGTTHGHGDRGRDGIERGHGAHRSGGTFGCPRLDSGGDRIGQGGSGPRNSHPISAGVETLSAINCGAIPPELVDSELFGHERAASPGRWGIGKAGSSGPTAAPCCSMNAANSRWLPRSGCCHSSGRSVRARRGRATRHVDVRIVAATHRDLESMVAEGRFRQDLWYRLAVFPVHLPPLRDRLSDIPALAAYFTLRAVKRLGFPRWLPRSRTSVCWWITLARQRPRVRRGHRTGGNPGCG